MALRGAGFGLAFLMASVCLLPAAWTAPARANTRVKTTELAAGGLHFPYNSAIKISLMEVRIGLDAVRLDYVLINHGKTEQTFLASFLLPELDMSALVWENVRLPVENDSNFVAFAPTVDGKPVDAEIQQRSRAMGLDVTRQLFDNNIPLFPLADATSERLAALPADRQARLRENGIAAVIDGALQPMWSLASTLHWRQAIKPATPLAISATYQPVVGISPLAAEDLERLTESHCFGTRGLDAIAKRAAAGLPVSEAIIVTYSVSSGANLLGLASTLRVVIELPDESTVAATCRDGFRRTGPLTLEFMRPDAIIEDDISVVFLK